MYKRQVPLGAPDLGRAIWGSYSLVIGNVIEGIAVLTQSAGGERAVLSQVLQRLGMAVLGMTSTRPSQLGTIW